MPTHYTYSKELWLSGRPMVHMIKTPLSNICTETICKPLTNTAYSGINGGFYDTVSYDQTPTGGRSIAYDKAEGLNTITVNGKTFDKNYYYNGVPTNQVSRKTMCISKSSTGVYSAGYKYAKTVSEMKAAFPNAEQIIGGNDYNLDSWGSKAYYAPIQRTVLAWKGSYAYLIVTEVGALVSDMKNYVTQLGLDPVNSIMLDGSGSTAMKVPEFTKKGDERHIFNMIRLKNAY